MAGRHYKFGEGDKQPTITSNYCGDHAGQYIAAALKEAKSLDYLTLLENIKFERSITSVANADMVAARTCDFTKAGQLVLTDKKITPVPLQINYEMCKMELVKEWQAAQMKAGQWNTNMGPEFATFVLQRLADIIAQHSENNIWSGAAVTPGQFEGFMTAATGLFVVDPVTNAPAVTGGAYAVGTVIADLSALLTAVPSPIYSRIAEDVYMYMNPNTYRMYLSAVSALGYVNAYNMQDTYQPYFEGCKIAVVPGMPDNNACVAQTSNLFFGTDLLSDETEIRVLDMATIDGSDNIRIVAKYTAAVQTGIASDITWQK